MQIKQFYRTQRDLSKTLNVLVDSYWDESINEEEFIKHIKTIYENNAEKIIKNNRFTTVLLQQSGKRRLTVVLKILHNHFELRKDLFL